jgi:hypothetical protein
LLLLLQPFGPQNPTPDLIDAKLRQLKLHRKDTFTWDELAHLW